MDTGPSQSLSTIFANLGLKNICSMSVCCSCQNAKATPFKPVGHFNTPIDVVNMVLCVVHSFEGQIPSHAEMKRQTKRKCANVDAALINEVGSDKEAARTSHLFLGKRNVRIYRQPQV